MAHGRRQGTLMHVATRLPLSGAAAHGGADAGTLPASQTGHPAQRGPRCQTLHSTQCGGRGEAAGRGRLYRSSMCFQVGLSMLGQQQRCRHACRGAAFGGAPKMEARRAAGMRGRCRPTFPGAAPDATEAQPASGHQRGAAPSRQRLRLLPLLCRRDLPLRTSPRSVGRAPNLGWPGGRVGRADRHRGQVGRLAAPDVHVCVVDALGVVFEVGGAHHRHAGVKVQLLAEIGAALVPAEGWDRGWGLGVWVMVGGCGGGGVGGMCVWWS